MTASWPLLVVAGVLGLAIGSFLNVVIHRVPLGLSVVSPPSRCPGCESHIKARHNVPVLGWLVLRGRCAGCAMPISVRYPLVEAGTAALFVLITWRAGLSTALPVALFLGAIAVSLTLIDVDVRRLPMRLLALSLGVVVVLTLGLAAGHDHWPPVWHAALGAVVMASVPFIVRGLARLVSGRPATRRLTEQIALAALLGMYLGWLSWTALLLGVIAAAIVAVADNVRIAPRPLPSAAVLVCASLAVIVTVLPSTGGTVPLVAS